METTLPTLRLEPELLAFDAGGIEVKEAEGGGLISSIEGYGAIFGNVDDGADIMHRGFFAKSASERVPKGLVPYLDSHRWTSEGTIGNVKSAAEDEKGLRFRAAISSAASAQDHALKVADGTVTRLSVGFETINETFEKDEGKVIRHLKEGRLFEISQVPLAMNEETFFLSAKSAGEFGLELAEEMGGDWTPERAEARVRSWAQKKGGGGTNWTRYRRAFVCFDRERAEARQDPALLLCDVKGGRLVVPPEALWGLAEALLTGSLDASPADLKRAQRTVGRYLAKLRLRRKALDGSEEGGHSEGSQTSAAPAPSPRTPAAAKTSDRDQRARALSIALDL